MGRPGIVACTTNATQRNVAGLFDEFICRPVMKGERMDLEQTWRSTRKVMRQSGLSPTFVSMIACISKVLKEFD